MLIPFDNYFYAPMTENESRPTEIIWLNPTEVSSVHGIKEDRFKVEKCLITMKSRGEEEEGNHEWTVVGNKDYIAKIINTAILGPVTHVQAVDLKSRTEANAQS